MKILVSFKRVPDAATPDEKWVVNPFDEIAVEEALLMKERGDASEVVAVTIADEGGEEQIRSVLAMGVDRAIRVPDKRKLDSYAVARILRRVVEAESPALVLMGKQAVDDDSNQVGQMLAGLLNWPQATFVSKVELEDGKAVRCTREIDSGFEVVRLRLPAVVTVDLRLNEPRYVSLPGLMKARRKPIEIFEVDAQSFQPRITVLSTTPSARRSAGTRLESVEELVAKLRECDKVI